MGIITDIQPQKKNPNRVSIFIDGEFYVGMDLFTSQKHRLKIDSEVDEEKLMKAVFDAEIASSFEKALGLINARFRAESEIEDYLKQKLYSEEVLEATIEKLKSYNYVDDREFCRLYIESHKKRWGAKKIEYMLKGLKIDSDILSEAMAEVESQEAEAVRLLEKYFKSKPFDKNKAYTHLAQKGFKSDCIKQAILRNAENSLNDE